MVRLINAGLAGGLFGTGLFISGMTDTRKVQGFLDVFGQWDPTLIFVLGGAILPMAMAWFYAGRLTAKGLGPAAGGTFPIPKGATFDGSLIFGSVAFGAGWALVGLCPGPALASLGFGGTSGLIFLLAMCSGMWIAPIAKRLTT